MALVKHGIVANTPKDLMFGAGVIYKNLTYTAPVSPQTEGSWSGTVLGATSGGAKLNITPEYVSAELDGATVKVEGGTFKVGESATLEATFTELNAGVIVEALHLVEDSNTTITGMKKYDTKSQLASSDFLTNIAFVGALTDGKNVIVVMENALCTSALEIEAKDKTQSTYSCKFECHAGTDATDLGKLPVHIYLPNRV